MAKKDVVKKARQLYKIGDLVELLGLTPRTIRYYDQIGLLSEVKRSDGKMRLFDDNDVETIRQIRRLQKEEFLPLDVIKERLYGNKKKNQDKIAIVVDSAAVIPSDVRNKLNIFEVPFHIKIKGKDMDGSHKFTASKLWSKIKKPETPVEMAAPSEAEFIKLYKALYDKGFRIIYSIHISDMLSETIRNAKCAANKVVGELTVKVVDSQSYGASQGLLAEVIAEAARDKTSQEVDLAVSKHQHHLFQLIAMNSLDYLIQHKPRVNSALNMSILNKIGKFVPVVELNKSGEVDVLSIPKTVDDAIDYILEQVQSEFESRARYFKRISVTYSHLNAQGSALANAIKAEYPDTEVHLCELSGIVSAYLGPNSLSVSII